MMAKHRFGRYTVETSSEEKVLFPEARLSKGDLISYYRRIAPIMLRHLRNRPLAMRRYPKGVDDHGFIQQNASDYFPDWLQTATVEKAGGEITHVLCNNAATLVYLANQNMVTAHTWLSRADRPRSPDQVIFDLDPSGGSFDDVRFAAHAVRRALEEVGLVPYVMTTGSKGVHVRAPVHRDPDFDDVRAWARELARRLADANPDRLTTEHLKEKRGGRIYLDTGRNAYGQTAVAPYSVRAREKAPVATPIRWDELDDPAMSPRKFGMEAVIARVERDGDPMGEMGRRARSLRTHV